MEGQRNNEEKSKIHRNIGICGAGRQRKLLATVARSILTECSVACERLNLISLNEGKTKLHIRSHKESNGVYCSD